LAGAPPRSPRRRVIAIHIAALKDALAKLRKRRLTYGQDLAIFKQSRA
jgi:hypothetical protein